MRKKKIIEKNQNPGVWWSNSNSYDIMTNSCHNPQGLIAKQIHIDDDIKGIEK